ncbi:MAG: substrate-binding domain-containing protein, partial [Chitinophagaceae bacterium]
MKRICIFLFLTLSGLQTVLAQARSLRIAVAANAQFVMRVLQADFKKRTGIETGAIIGSSGNLSTQIRNGAPFDMFLSADMEFPDKLFAEGFAITKPREYALGSLIVCSTGSLPIDNWRELVK